MATTIHSTAKTNTGESSPSPANPGHEAVTGAAAGRGFSRWIAYAVATGLMLTVLFLLQEIASLKTQLAAARADADRLRASEALAGLRLTTLEAKEPAYAAAQIIIAWDPYRCRGMAAVQNLPAPPAGQDYQLWVLDPNASMPIGAGLLNTGKPFTIKPISTAYPGFAVTLEPIAGSPILTGPILFAVAPGP
jgi:anti-sigma-K factor RskA